MLPRFLLLIGSLEMRQEAAYNIEMAGGWLSTLVTPAFELFLSRDGDMISLGDRGAIIGPIFRRHGPPSVVTAIDCQEAETILADGEVLLERYWGTYVAVLGSEPGVRVLRDPSGAFPCCHFTSNGLTVFAADAAALLETRLWSPGIDWRNLARHFYTRGLPSARTALAGVTELLPGFCAHSSTTGIRTVASWSPWNYVQPGNVQASQDVEALYRVIGFATRALASRHQRLLIGVSGGLDSSIVLACLKDRHADILAATATTLELDGDERDYARIVCDALQIDLVEAPLSLSDVDVAQAAAPHLLRPTSRTQSQAYNAIMARIVAASSIDAFCTGNGGDNVFAFSQSAVSIYDRFLSEGLSTGTLRTLLDVCALNGCSPYAALRSVLRTALSSSRSYNWICDPLFLNETVIAAEAMEPVEHSWLQAPTGVPPGKAAHVSMLLRIQQHLQASAGGIGVEVLTPLMSQPVIEACLSIPTWRWCVGGRNRAVAREAFASDLPQAIIARRSKGGPDSFCSDLIEANRNEILERLLHGRMADAGILDLRSIELALVGDAQIKAHEHVEILGLIEAEAWIDQWVGGPAERDNSISAFNASQ
jgi:asparagine synthase (glutamine-hydrolysing)